MGVAHVFRREKLVVGVLYSRRSAKSEILRRLGCELGPIESVSAELEFRWSNYYDSEMGTPIRRFFVSLQDLVSPDSLADIKQHTNRIEAAWASGGKRAVNLDPGLVGLSRFVLASTKDSPHRVPLKDGIYAEVTLVYERGFRPLEWTYPDYRSSEYRDIIDTIRSNYRAQIKQQTERSAMDER